MVVFMKSNYGDKEWLSSLVLQINSYINLFKQVIIITIVKAIDILEFKLFNYLKWVYIVKYRLKILTLYI